MNSVFALRFDVDSVTCIERGIPELRRLADRLAIRFTFFVNMGYSFNWSHNIRHFAKRRRERKSASRPPANDRLSLPTSDKLGWGGILKTAILNPRLGDRYQRAFDALHADGHELGLHGGMDHVVWQRSLDELDEQSLERLFRPAFDRFSERYGRPAGFASPGFRFDRRVLELLDREGFIYASDMDGEVPFLPVGPQGEQYRHYQVPVNVSGERKVPLIEQGRARGRSTDEIEAAFVRDVEARDFALAYGHPYVEGQETALLGRILERVQRTHDIVTVGTYLQRWLVRHG